MTSAGLLSDISEKYYKDLPIKKLIVRIGPSSHFVLSSTDTPFSLAQVTNTIDQTKRLDASSGILTTIDIAPVLAESIRRTHNG